jgi:hypothetical protein
VIALDKVRHGLDPFSDRNRQAFCHATVSEFQEYHMG